MNTETKHTPEPWQLAAKTEGVQASSLGITTADGLNICSVWTPVSKRGQKVAELHAIREANARRIVACVNACAGISTETLEAAPPWKAYRQDDQLRQQRDELAAALAAFLRAPSIGSKGPGSVTIEVQTFNLDAARAALAKVQP